MSGNAVTVEGIDSLGSGYIIGDGYILTAGHVVFEYNRITQTVDTDKIVALDLRFYHSSYVIEAGRRRSNGESLIPKNIEGDSTVFPDDMVVIQQNTADDGTPVQVDKDDEGIVLFIDHNEIRSAETYFSLSSFRVISDSDNDSVNIVDVRNDGVTIINDSVVSGDSGGGFIFEFESKRYVLGNIIGHREVPGPDRAYVSHFRMAEYYAISNLLSTGRIGNQTGDEPTNLLIGTNEQDNTALLGLTGTFRADIILARGGDDAIFGDALNAIAWGNDQIFGGTGNDILDGGKGSNLLHGGDHRSYGGGARVALNDDGSDTVSYSSLALDDPGSSIVISFDQTLDPIYASTADAAARVAVQVNRPGMTADVDALISIETLYGTEEADSIELNGWTAAQVSGTDGRGGLATIDFGAGVDTVDGSGLSDGLTIDLVSGLVQSRANGSLRLTVLNAETVIGSEGADVITGNAAGNSIRGGGGNDQIDGGGGVDTLDYTGASAALLVVVWDSATSSWTVEAGSHGNDVVKNVEAVASDAPVLILDIDGTPRPDDLLSVSYQNSSGLFIANFSAMDGVTVAIGADRSGSALDTATLGGVTLSGVGTDIIGSAGNDSITDFSPDAKTISGADGNDVIALGDGDALVFAGEGSDIVVSGAGNDIIFDVNGPKGERFASQVVFGLDQVIGLPPAHSYIASGAGDDDIAVAFADRPVNDPLNENGVNVGIDAGAGNDTVDIDFYNGKVSYEYQRGDGNDIVNLKYHNGLIYSTDWQPDGFLSRPMLYFDLSDFDAAEITATWSQDILILVGEDLPNGDVPDQWLQVGTLTLAFSDGGSITVNNVAAVVSSPGPLSGVHNPIDAPPQGYIQGLPGAQYFIGSNGQGEIQTLIVGGSGQRPLSATKAIPQEADSAPTLPANEGDQTIVLKSGTHSYSGGSGVDRLIVSWDLSSIAVGFDAGVLTISDRWGRVGSTTLSNFDQIYVVADRKTYTPAEFYATYGDFGSTELLGDGQDNALTAGAGSDRLFGFEGADLLYGLGGNDFLDGGTGADTMRGGTGNDIYIVEDSGDVVKESVDAGIDTVRSSVSHTLATNVENLELLGSALSGTGNAAANRIDGNDLDNVLTGLAGNDRLVGGAGIDLLYGGDGEDYLKGGTGGDALFGENGNDIILGELGSDSLDGGAGDDALVGGDGLDKLTGGDGEDSLEGGEGGDTLRGGGDNGDDSLAGGTGIDEMSGGLGGDLFRFSSGETGSTTSTADRITDFSQEQGDRISLTAMDAIVGGADDAFTFIGTAAFGTIAGQLRYELIGGNTYVMGDTDGDGSSDFMIRVDGALVLTGADFSL